MTRRLLAFFAAPMLAAQCRRNPNGTVTCSGEVSMSMDCRGMDCKVAPRIGRPKNGECPVCGTMAKLFTKPYAGGFRYTDGTIYRRIDCDHCGCAFRQWAEGKEPKR